MSLRNKDSYEDSIDSTDTAEICEQSRAPHQLHDGLGGLHCQEDDEELESDQGPTHQGLQVRGEPFTWGKNARRILGNRKYMNYP